MCCVRGAVARPCARPCAMPHEDIVPLVEFREGAYAVNEETLRWLSAREAPFAVVSCAGKYRTGKSFLMNRLTDSAPGQGFGVGETVQACTRGIWVCKRFIQGGATDLLMCDTEGIDALDAECEHDVRVFALAVLMSSVFLYNSNSHLDEAAVQTLSLMTKIAESVGVEDTHDPHFYWVLRDFALQLADAAGRPMTTSQYLEQSLSPTGGAKCGTRDAIKQVFKTRHLVTLPRPQKSESSQKLEHKGPNALSAKFEKQLNALRATLAERAPPVSANGLPMTGAIFAEYLRTLVTKLNTEGVVPKIEDTFALLRRAQAQDAARTYRRDLLHKANADCPRGNEETIRAWISGIPHSLPPFVGEEVIASVRDEVFAVCVSAGRLQTARERMQEELAYLLEERRFEEDNERHDASESMRVIKDAIQKGFELGREQGGAVAVHEGQMEIMTLNATIDALRREIDDQRKIRDDAEPDASRTTTCVDACVGPNDSFWDEAARSEVAAEEESPTSSVECSILLGSLQESEERSRVLAEELDAVVHREAQMKNVFNNSMEELRISSCKAIDDWKKETEAHKGVALRESKQREALAQECDKNRDIIRRAQEAAVDVHKNVLEEIRRRDVQGRALEEERRGQWSAMAVKMELSENENRGLKRQLSDLRETEVEVKRLRNALHAVEVAKVHATTELAQHKTQLDAYRQEVTSLRRANVQLETRAAVLEATSKLESCRRSMA